MMRYLYIDDERSPKTDKNWVVVRNITDSINYMKENGCPEYISFDHDLAREERAIEIVKWMVKKDLDEKGTFIPKNFEFNVHSANPEGAKNIQGYLDSYLGQREI